jgi:ammonium transporter Rh
MLFYGFWNQALIQKTMGKIPLDIKMLIQGDYGAAASLIAMGALLGKTSFPQLMIVITVECIFYSLNRVICIDLLGIHDLSVSMVINVFGAYFGLAASMFFNPTKAIKDSSK